jgi:hypothetical protein
VLEWRGLKDVAEEWVTAAKEVERVSLVEDEYGADDANGDTGHPEEEYESANNS